MSEKFTIEIISPDKIILQAEAKEVVIPSFEGEMGILKDHIPLITFLRPGLVNIIGEDKKTFFVEEGTVEFSNNNLLILSATAQELSKIDKNSLKNLIDDAEKKVKNENFSDKERYLLSYKVQTLKTLNQ